MGPAQSQESQDSLCRELALGAGPPGCPRSSFSRPWTTLSSFPAGVSCRLEAARHQGPWPGAPRQSEQLPSFPSAQPAPQDLGLTARMKVRRATKTIVRKPRRLKDGGLGPDTPSGKGLRVGDTSDLLNQEMVLRSLARIL